MSKSIGFSTQMTIAILLNRLALGGIMFFAGLRKMMPFDSFTANLTKFAERAADMAPLPMFLGRAYGYALPFVELLAGLMMILGLWFRLSATVIALVMLSILIAAGINWWPASGTAYDRNVVLFTLALLLVATGPAGFSLDEMLPRRRRRS